MKRIFSFFLALAMLLAFTLPAAAAPAKFVVPTFSIVSVVPDVSVTIRTSNFPAHDSFDVLMNYMGTRGLKGIKVTSVDSGSGGAFTATYNIPTELKGQYQIALRLQSNTGSGYYAFNWFYNNPGGTNTGGGSDTPPGYYGIPTFTIASVVRDTTVTIKTRNFPANESFDVLMGLMGTRGVKGIKVASVDSGSGGSFTATYNIPEELKGKYQIAIRLQSNTGSGYYAYNWFYNSTTP